jgi:hypothetical protein
MFLIDVSREAVQNGVVDLVCRSILANIDKMAGDTRTKIAFITCVHWFTTFLFALPTWL